MNSRQGALLRALLEASGYRTSADYARRFGCSDRTIRTDVKALNSFSSTRDSPRGGPPARGRAAPCAGSRRGEPARALARGE
ncbi:MAG: HTH domain-containing protein [Adlercreutzia sp.]